MLNLVDDAPLAALGQLAEALDLGLLVLGTNGRGHVVRSANEAAGRRLGYAPEALSGVAITEVLETAIPAPWTALPAKQGLRGAEGVAVRADGVRFDVRLGCIASRVRGVAAVVVLFNDVRQRATMPGPSTADRRGVAEAGSPSALREDVEVRELLATLAGDMRGPLTVLGMAGFQEVQGERRALIDRNLAHLLRRVDGLDDVAASTKMDLAPLDLLDALEEAARRAVETERLLQRGSIATITVEGPHDLRLRSDKACLLAAFRASLAYVLSRSDAGRDVVRVRAERGPGDLTLVRITSAPAGLPRSAVESLLDGGAVDVVSASNAATPRLARLLLHRVEARVAHEDAEGGALLIALPRTLPAVVLGAGPGPAVPPAAPAPAPAPMPPLGIASGFTAAARAP